VQSFPGEGIGQVIQSEGLYLDSQRLGNNTAAMSDPALVLKKPNSKADYGTNASGSEYNDENGKRGVARTNTLGIKRIAKSGSLVERIEHVGGVPKTVIETTVNSDDEGSVSSKKSGSSGRDGERKPLLG
jgi:metal transporter CNNM